MLRQVILVLSIALVGSVTLASATLAEPVAPMRPIGQMIWEEHLRSASHPQPLPLPAADPVAAAREALTVETHGGRTPMAWVDLAAPERLLALRAAPREADLAAETLRLAALAGAPQDAALVQAQADAVPDALRAPFAALVATVADAYAEQRLLAGSTQLTDAERDATIARAERIFAALNDMRAAADGLALPASGAPIFSDPEGIVVLGGQGPDTWTSGGAVKDPVLLVDLGGDDLYLNSAGGACGAAAFHACNNVPLSIVADLAGNDQYRYAGVPYSVQGSGSIGGLGILVDTAGDDVYVSNMTRSSSGPGGLYQDGVAQGGANAGVGLLIDATGEDVYLADTRSTNPNRPIWNFAQGFGGYGGYAALADGEGDDMFLSHSYGVIGVPADFVGLYTNGVGFYGGVGVQLDVGASDDIYRAHAEAQTTDYYAQGFGAFGGVGILYEDGGDDDYAAGHTAHDPYIQPLLNCAFGTGSFGGVGIFLEMGGHDNYLGYSNAGSGKYAYTMNEGFAGPAAAYGLFVDVSGDDGHFMEATGGTKSDTFGRGVLLEHGQFVGLTTDGRGGGNHVGNYLDLGGADQYTGAPPSRNGATWSGGADLDLTPSLALAAVLG